MVVRLLGPVGTALSWAVDRVVSKRPGGRQVGRPVLPLAVMWRRA